MAKQKLDLLKLSSRQLAEPCAGPSQVMRSQLSYSGPFCRFLNHMPDGFLGQAGAPDMPASAHSSKDPSLRDTGSCDPDLQFSSHPVWNRNGPDVPALTDHVNNCPMIFPLFKVSQSKVYGFLSPQTASEKKCQESSIPFTFQDLSVWSLP